MSCKVCPWWLGYMLLNPLRRLFQNPAATVAEHVSAGMTVVEPGPGMGFFTLELAKRVEPAGKVVAVDLQQKMLDVLCRRAQKAGVAGQLETRLGSGKSLGLDDLDGKVDFVLAMAVVHELPDAQAFMVEAARALKPGGRMLLSEPAGHVSGEAFEHTLSLATKAGFQVVSRSGSRFGISAVLQRA